MSVIKHLKETTTTLFNSSIHKTLTILVPHVRFEVFSNAQTFCGKLEPLYSTQYSSLFVTYTNGFDMHTEQPNPQSINDEYVSAKS